MQDYALIVSYKKIKKIKIDKDIFVYQGSQSLPRVLNLHQQTSK